MAEGEPNRVPPGADPPHPYGDYGGWTGTAPAVYEAPIDGDGLAEIVRSAASRGQPMRVRCHAHSMNGLATPRRDEVLIDTHVLNAWRYDGPDRITVGAGAAVRDVQTLVQRHGRSLLVFNDGGAAASSIGGYLSAGGIGAASERHGGFWASVTGVRLIDGQGERHDLTPTHADFPWLFGSMGQLGVIESATLRLLGTPKPGHPNHGTVPASPQGWEKILWWTIFAPEDQADQAREDIIKIGVAHRLKWRGRWPYRYHIASAGFTPPLIHPHQGALVANGIWGTPLAETFEDGLANEIDADVMQMLATRPSYRRYVQTERTPKPFDYAACFGRDVFEHFQALKQRYDPKGLLNRGVF